jgi:hypothetical protein
MRYPPSIIQRSFVPNVTEMLSLFYVIYVKKFIIITICFIIIVENSIFQRKVSYIVFYKNLSYGLVTDTGPWGTGRVVPSV